MESAKLCYRLISAVILAGFRWVMKRLAFIKNKPAFNLLAWLLSFTAAAFPQANGTPAARKEFDSGETSRKAADFAAAAGTYRKAIELDPNFAKAHEQYILTTEWAATRALEHPDKSEKAKAGDNDKAKAEHSKRIAAAMAKARVELTEQYGQWAKEHPEKAVYEWALGYINMENDPHATEAYYLAALKIDPRFGRAHSDLAILEQDRGDLAGALEDMRKAIEADPSDPECLFSYAYTMMESNSAESQRLFLDLWRKFPADESAARALYWLAVEAPSASDKIRYLDLLRTNFPPEKFDWSSDGQELLLELYDESAPEKALRLADEMSKAMPKDEDWKTHSSYEHGMIKAEQMLAEKKAADAVEVLSKLSLPWNAEHQRLDALRARAADANGETGKAYADLLKIFAQSPTDALGTLAASYGQKLGKDAKQLDADVLKVREANAKPAPPFSLPGYDSNSISLADFKGRVTLLNFWFPECGPCHEEFPYIQKVLDKYKDQGFAIVAVNVQPDQDTLVMPLLKGYKLGFIPAKADDKIEIAYGVHGAPTSFLIGPDGRIWYRMGPVFDAAKQHTLELQIGLVREICG
jgi:thiol-disulfide isomerase/thioredoxin